MAPAPFDALGKQVFDITTSVMGYDASWAPSAGGGAFSAKVHLKSPSRDDELAGFAYNPRYFISEWKENDLPGLDTAFSQSNEKLTVNGRLFDVIHVRALHDGQVFQAILELTQ